MASRIKKLEKMKSIDKIAINLARPLAAFGLAALLEGCDKSAEYIDKAPLKKVVMGTDTESLQVDEIFQSDCMKYNLSITGTGHVWYFRRVEKGNPGIDIYNMKEGQEIKVPDLGYKR